MPLLHPAVIESVNNLLDKFAGKVSINLGMDFSADTVRKFYEQKGTPIPVDASKWFTKLLQTNFSIKNIFLFNRNL